MHTHQFNTAEQLSAYLGLVPIERQSGSSLLGRAKLSKAGPARIRAVLYMAAIVATKYNPYVKALFERLLARGKSNMSELGTCMRKLVHLCFGVLKTQKSIKESIKKLDRKDSIYNSEILAILYQSEAGSPVSEDCQERSMTSASFYRWRARSGGMYASMMARLKKLESENV